MHAVNHLWCGDTMSHDEIPFTLLRPNSGSYRDAVTDHAISLLAQHGAVGVTLRSLADELQMSPQGVRRWFGSIDKTWEAIADTFARRWVQWQENVYGRDPGCTARGAPHLALPLDDLEVTATRAWFALTEHCNHSDELAGILAPWQEHEARGIGRLVSGCRLEPLEGIELTVIVAFVRGLRLQMASRHDPLGLVEAHAALLAGLPSLLPVRASVHARE